MAIRSLVLIVICLLGLTAAFGQTGAAQPTGRVAVFIAQRLFQDEEFDPVVRALSRAGFEVVTVSVETTAAQSMNGELVKPKLALRDLRAGDFAGLVLIGGTGIVTLWDDSLLHERCREFAAAGRMVAAIGIAPIVLARAGVLQGHQAAVFHEANAVAELRRRGCRFRFNRVVTSGNIVTAASAESVRPFARTIIRVLKKG